VFFGCFWRFGSRLARPELSGQEMMALYVLIAYKLVLYDLLSDMRWIYDDEVDKRDDNEVITRVMMMML